MENKNFWETLQTFYLYVYKPKQFLITILVNRIKNCKTENNSETRVRTRETEKEKERVNKKRERELENQWIT